jgi:hypothetical protein
MSAAFMVPEQPAALPAVGRLRGSPDHTRSYEGDGRANQPLPYDLLSRTVPLRAHHCLHLARFYRAVRQWFAEHRLARDRARRHPTPVQPTEPAMAHTDRARHSRCPRARARLPGRGFCFGGIDANRTPASGVAPQLTLHNWGPAAFLASTQVFVLLVLTSLERTCCP